MFALNFPPFVPPFLQSIAFQMLIRNVESILRRMQTQSVSLPFPTFFGDIMRPILILPFLLITSYSFAADETRTVSSFQAIRSEGVFTLIVNAGKPQSLNIDADDKLLSKIKTEVIGNELVIKYDEKNKSHNLSDKIRITINMPELKQIKIEGVGETTLNQLVGDKIDIQYEGVGKLTANGKVKTVSIHAEGVGEIDSKDLYAERAEVHVEGVGSVKVRASEDLNASLDGVGSLTYYGKPKHISKRADGLGSVRAGE